MRVKVKKGTFQSMLPGLFITILFGSVSIFIFARFYKHMNGDYSFEGFTKALSNEGIVIIFGLIILAFTIYFIYAFIKPPQKYLAQLKKKKYEIIDGEEVTSLFFEVNKQKKSIQYISTEYSCYVKGKNNYIEGENYIILIKEYNWKIKAVEECKNEAVRTTMRNISMKPVFAAIIIILASELIIALVKKFNRYNQGKVVFMDWLPMLFIVIFIVACGFIYRQWTKDNSLLEKREYVGKGPSSGKETLPVGLLGRKSFKVERKNLSMTHEKYVVLDEEDNLIYELDENQYTQVSIRIFDPLKNNIGMISVSPINGMEKYTVKLNGYNEFSVRKKVTVNNLYEVNGLDYKVDGNLHGSECTILDLNDRLQARISMQDSITGMRKAGYSNVFVENDIENNIFIIFISACVTIGNFKSLTV